MMKQRSEGSVSRVEGKAGKGPEFGPVYQKEGQCDESIVSLCKIESERLIIVTSLQDSSHEL